MEASSVASNNQMTRVPPKFSCYYLMFFMEDYRGHKPPFRDHASMATWSHELEDEKQNFQREHVRLQNVMDNIIKKDVVKTGMFYNVPKLNEDQDAQIEQQVAVARR